MSQNKRLQNSIEPTVGAVMLILGAWFIVEAIFALVNGQARGDPAPGFELIVGVFMIIAGSIMLEILPKKLR